MIQKINKKWNDALQDEFKKEYFLKLSDFVSGEYSKGESMVFPSESNIFNAYELCLPDNVKVVILGQDPYHGEGEANGLAFAVSKNVSIPPSLRNIFKEIKSDLNIETIPDGDLTRWAEQGVFLLNSTLTVRANTPGSHQKKGWEEFIDATIKYLSDKKTGLVFMLWGNYAKSKSSLIDNSKHLILQTTHPSPFSAHSGFLGCKHFSKANIYLKEKGLSEIDWR